MGEKPKLIHGVWDLPMIGNERLEIEGEYHCLADGPEVNIISPFGPLIMDEKENLWKIKERRYGFEYESYREIIPTPLMDKLKPQKADRYEVSSQNEISDIEQTGGRNSAALPDSLLWCEAYSLPPDRVLVVRMTALREFEKRMSTEDKESEKSSNTKKETTAMHIVGALFQLILDEKIFKTRTELYEHIDAKYRYLRVQGLTTSNLSRWLPEGERYLIRS